MGVHRLRAYKNKKNNINHRTNAIAPVWTDILGKRPPRQQNGFLFFNKQHDLSSTIASSTNTQPPL
jgi:hypothetical protein